MAGFGFDGDPFSQTSPLGSPASFHRPRQPRPEYRQPLDAPQAEAFTKRLTNTGLSGLQYVLSSLDKPGRAVRGVLGGHTDEALAAIPFSDSLGLTDPNRAITGRKLLDNAGLTSRGDKGWGSFLGGVGAEMALDPLTYATFGTSAALTKLGRAAANAGDLRHLSMAQRMKGYSGVEPTLRAAGVNTEHLMNQGAKLAGQPVVDAAARLGTTVAPNKPLGGLVGIGLPFRDPALVIGTGNAAQAAAGGLGKIGTALQKTGPVRYARAAFDNSVRDARGYFGQQAMSQYGAPAGEAIARNDAGSIYRMTQGAEHAIKAGLPEKQVLSAARETAEGVPLAAHAPEVYSAGQPIASELRSMYDTKKGAADKIGLNLKDVNDPYALHVHRSGISETGRSPQGLTPHSKFPTTSTNMARRDLELREIPGGTEAFQRWAAQHSGQPQDLIEPAVAADIQRTLQRMGVNLDPMGLKAMDDKTVAVAEKLSGLDPKYLEMQHGPLAAGLQVPGHGGFFSPNVIGDAASYAAKDQKMQEAAHAVMGAIHQNVRPMSEFAKGEGVSIPDFLRQMKLVSRGGDPATGALAQGALVEALKKAAAAGAPDITPMLSGKIGPLRKLGKQYGVPQAVAGEFAEQYPRWVAPHTVSGPVGVLDTATNMFKNMAYSIWPASHVRNAVSALTNNAMSGAGPGSHALAMRIMRDTATAAEIGAAHPGMPAGLTDELAREWVKGQAYQHSKVFQGHNAATDLAAGSAAARQAGRISPELPGAGRTGPTKSLLGDIANLGKEAVLGKPGETSPAKILGQSGVGQSPNPLAQKVFGKLGYGDAADTWSPLAAGRTAGTNIEDYFRLSNYLGNVGQGMSPTEAGRMVNKVHFDYSAATPFEKKVMRRLVPFFTFQRHNLPLQLERMTQRPASISAQLRPFGRNDPDQYTPDHIASGIAIPTGPEQDGNQQFISQLGLPVEEAFDRWKFKNDRPDMAGTAMSYLAGANPLLKGPLEKLFDTQLHTGRKLSDLRPTGVGQLFGQDNAGLATQILANTPATRFATATDKLMDERKPLWAKALNLGTGVRVTDVDMNKTRAIEARKALEAMLKGSRNVSSYTNFYVRPEQKDNLTPEEVEQMRMLSLLQQNARAYAESQRAKGR